MRNLAPDLVSDVLSDMLRSVHFQSTIFCRSELTAPWGFAVRGGPFASFHIVLDGEGVLEVEGVERARRLAAGDLVILPQGHAHVVRDTPASPATSLEELVADHPLDASGTLRNGGGNGGAETVLLCGRFHYQESPVNPLFRMLPPVMVVRGDGGRAAPDWIALTLRFLDQESRAVRIGGSAVSSRLADILFIEAIRSFVALPEARGAGLRAVLHDPRIGAVMARLHRRPEATCDVASLASSAGMSRTAFTLRFIELVGVSPMRYVTRCRMEKAATLLRATGAAIADVGQRVGYDSELGFARAFKRHAGVSPAVYRAGASDRP